MTNLKTFFSVAAVTVTVSLFTMTPNHAQNEKLNKHKIVHNGITLCLPAIAVDAHIRQHNKEGGKVSCTRAGLCSDQQTTSPTIPPTVIPPTVEEPVCNGCQ